MWLRQTRCWLEWKPLISYGGIVLYYVPYLFCLFPSFFFVSDTETVGNIKNVCRACSENFSKTSSPSLDAMFFIPSSTQVLYNLEVRTLYVDVYG